VRNADNERRKRFAVSALRNFVEDSLTIRQDVLGVLLSMRDMRRSIGLSGAGAATRRACLGLLSGMVLGLFAVGPTRANEVDFPTWLTGLRQEALGLGIRQATLDASLTGIKPIPRILELDRAQPEHVLSFAEYIDRVVNDHRVEAAQARRDEYRALFDEIARKYGVQPRFILALWGIESDFGRAMGATPVIPALATLAYDGRRGAFFRRELINALTIVDRGEARPEEMIGSWAGAMGQSQFMPSSYLNFAVDYTGDGRRDIWHRPADVLASIANYLSSTGWRADQGWGRKVRLPAGFDRSLIAYDKRRPLSEWRALGLRRSDGGPLPGGDELMAALIEPKGDGVPAFLVYDNFRTIMKWNSSFNFALAVGFLADRIE
jgi:membrane-bound lytic murein transglycosylase B